MHARKVDAHKKGYLLKQYQVHFLHTKVTLISTIPIRFRPKFATKLSNPVNFIDSYTFIYFNLIKLKILNW